RNEAPGGLNIERYAQSLRDVLRRDAGPLLRFAVSSPGPKAARRLGDWLLPGGRALRVGPEGAGPGEWKHPERDRQSLGSPRFVHLRRPHPDGHLGPEQRREHAAVL